MRFVSWAKKAGVATFLPLSAAASSQFIASLPHCWQSCVNSNSPSCSNQDLSCICSRAGSGGFLSNAASCINNNCSDDGLDPSQLIAPFQAACNANGNPIPSSAIRSRSLPSHSSDTAEGTTTTTGLASFTDSEGNIHSIAIPIVIGASTTEYGNPTTLSSDPSSSARTPSVSSSPVSNIPILGLPKSTVPSVSSDASSTTIAPIAIQMPSPTTTSSTSSSSSIKSSSSSSKSSSSTATSGSLLDLQGSGTRREARSLLGLILGVVAGVAWF